MKVLEDKTHLRYTLLLRELGLSDRLVSQISRTIEHLEQEIWRMVSLLSYQTMAKREGSVVVSHGDRCREGLSVRHCDTEAKEVHPLG